MPVYRMNVKSVMEMAEASTAVANLIGRDPHPTYFALDKGIFEFTAPDDLDLGQLEKNGYKANRTLKTAPGPE